MIKREGNKFVVYSKAGKSMGSYSSRKDAVQRLRLVEYYKSLKMGNYKGQKKK